MRSDDEAEADWLVRESLKHSSDMSLSGNLQDCLFTKLVVTEGTIFHCNVPWKCELTRVDAY